MKRLGLLGQVELFRSTDERTAFARPNQRRLIAVLGCHYRESVSSTYLADLLELSPGGLRTRVRRLRQLTGDDVVLTQSGGYSLGQIEIDAEIFHRLRSDAQQFQGQQRAERLAESLRVWRGDALEEFAHEQWAAGEAARLDELRSSTIDELAECQIGLGHYAQAIAELERQIARRPFRDKSRRLHMLGLAKAGRTTDALRGFQLYRDFLIDESGTEPPERTRQLERSILAGEVTVDETPTWRGAHPGGGLDAAETRRPAVVTILCCDLVSQSGRREFGAMMNTIARSTVGQILSVGPTNLAIRFDNPADCIAQAIEFHQGLQATAGVVVRAGVHAGVESEDPANDSIERRAASIMGCGTGGQILLSAETWALVAQGPFRAVRRGRHQPVGSNEPVEIVDVHWQSGDPTPAPLRTVSTIPTNVAPVRVNLLGRDDALADVRHTLATHRLVTLIGPGGAGKSALATEVAARLVAEYSDGVFVVELAAETNGDQIVRAIAHAVGHGASPAASAVGLAAELRDRAMLIVIDNAEHLVDDVAAVVEELCNHQGPTLLVTSRVWLDVPGEKTVAVDPLTNRAASGATFAAELFVANARAAGVDVAGFDLDAVEQLCARLDHLPLAIELAAGSAIHLSPSQILGALDRGDRMYATRRRTRSRRFTSVEEMLEGSFQLLDANARSLLLTLGVFRGPIPLQAIEGVWDAPGETNVLATLQSLVRRSFVTERPGEPQRYQLLETVRDFARDRLADMKTLTQVRRAHRDWYLEWSGADAVLYDFASTSRAVRYEEQLPNFREALAFSATTGDSELLHRQAVALTSVWFTFLRGDEGLRWLEQCSAFATAPEERVEHAVAMFAASFASERWDAIFSIATELGELGARVESPTGVLATALFGLTHVNDREVGLQIMADVRQRDQRLDAGLAPLIDHLTGDLCAELGDFEAAARHYQRAVRSLPANDFLWWESAAYVGQALALHAQGDTETAISLARRSLELADGLPESLGGRTRAIVTLSVLQSSAGDHYPAAMALLAEIERNEQTTRLEAVRAEPLVALMHLAFDRGEIEFGKQILAINVEAGVAHRSPWQSALCRLAQRRVITPPALPAEISVDEALRRARSFLGEGTTGHSIDLDLRDQSSHAAVHVEGV